MLVSFFNPNTTLELSFLNLASVPHPASSNLTFGHPVKLTSEEIVEIALN